MKSRKAQAAQEFIATYSWMMLAVLIVTGAFVYVGSSEVKKIRPASCEAGVGFECDDMAVTEAFDTYFELVLINKQGVDIVIDSVTLLDKAGRESGSCIYSSTVPRDGEVIISCPIGDIPYSKYNYYPLTTVMNYHRMGSNYVFTTIGEVNIRS